jgi:Zn-dependent metalloprotease
VTRGGEWVQFEQFANITTSVAGRLYGNGSTEQTTVADAWVQVGVLQNAMV